MSENGLSEVLSQLKKLDTVLEGIAAAQQRLESAQQRLESAQQRLETGQQDLWAALNAHARRTSLRFDEIESSVDKGFARVQGQVQELLTRIERQDARSDRLARRVSELEAPKPEPRWPPSGLRGDFRPAVVRRVPPWPESVFLTTGQSPRYGQGS